ncbi:MAG: hypothetical protein KF716_31610 [Anaerolineae bacterium]|nr:hypothetical protein [Anaerolineae bacterium]
MSTGVIERRIRLLLLILVAAICVGTVTELILRKHTGETIQFVPFVVSGLGLLSVIAVLVRPQATTIWVLRGVMVLAIGASLLGMWEHLETNYNFESEMRPNAAFTDVIVPTLMGAAPLLAPGILALGGVLGLAATYYHPALGKRTDA